MAKPLSKTYEAEYKVFMDDKGVPTGKIEFYASVFNNVDLVGDRVMPGAFEDSLKSWRDSGDPIPIVFSHNWGDPFAIIGWADPNEVTEDSKGLLVPANLDIDTNPTALQVFKLMQRRIMKEASFSYDVEEERTAKDGANNLFKLNILELGPCLKGANPLTDTVSAKSRDIKSLLQGSVEERMAALGYAAAAKFGGGENGVWTYIEGTYVDRVIVCVRAEDGEPVYYAVPYQITPEGDVVLGAESEVELETTVQPPEGRPTAAGLLPIPPPKAVEPEADTVVTKVETPDPDEVKAGARNSRADQESIQAAHDGAVKAGAECNPAEEAPQGAGAENIEVTAEVKDDTAERFLKLAADFQEIGDTDGELEMLDKARAHKHGDHDQSTHGNRDSDTGQGTNGPAPKPAEGLAGSLQRRSEGEESPRARALRELVEMRENRETAQPVVAETINREHVDEHADEIAAAAAEATHMSVADKEAVLDELVNAGLVDSETLAEVSLMAEQLERTNGTKVEILDELVRAGLVDEETLYEAGLRVGGKSLTKSVGDPEPGGSADADPDPEPKTKAADEDGACCMDGMTAEEHRAKSSDGRCCTDDPPTVDEKSVDADGAKATDAEGTNTDGPVKPDNDGMECPDCTGGKITVDGVEKECPTCEGTGRVAEKKSDAATSDAEAKGKDEEPERAKSEDPADAKARVASELAEMEALSKS